MSSINVSGSTPSSLCNSKESKHSKQTLEFFEKKNKAEADYEKYLIEILSSADSLGQVKQILSDKGELSEDMREALDRAINKEEKEQKKASEVPIQLIIKKIQIMKTNERLYEIQKSLKKNKPHFKKVLSMSDEPIPPSEREETDFYLDLGLDLLTEYLWINKKLNPSSYTGEDRAIFELAKFWPDHIPGFQDPEKLILLAQEIRKINQDLYMDELDSDEEAYKDSLIAVSGISLE